MAKRKAAVNCDIRPWLSARTDCKEGRFLQIGNSLLLSDQYQGLSGGTQNLYMCMAMESGGRQSFEFPLKTAKKYGISEQTLRRGVAQLIKCGFIDKQSNYNIRQPNEYRFSLAWKIQNAIPK